MRLRMRLFFPPGLGVRVEPVARPLPGVTQPPEFTPDGVKGGEQAGVLSQVGLEQGHGPGGARVTKVLRASCQKVTEQVSVRLGEQGGPAGAAGVSQHGGVAVAAVGGEPVVDGPRGHPQAVCDRGDRFTRGYFEDGEGAAEYSGIVGGPQLLFQTPPLPAGQGQGVHCLSSLPFRLPPAASR
jgi:hypothetical protein